MLMWLVGRVHHVVERSISSVLTTLVYVCLALSIAHALGWLERFIWWSLEREARKVLNRAKVTIGSFSLDWSKVLEGKISLHASNVIIHTPQREAWQWESPLVARIGSASVECNAPITIFHVVFFRKEVPLELYSVKVSDIQVFVERRDQVFNVYLMDPAAILPPPPNPEDVSGNDTSINANTRTGTNPPKDNVVDGHESVSNSADPVMQLSADEANDPSSNGSIDLSFRSVRSTGPSSTGDGNGDGDGDGSVAQHKEQAQKLVNDMLQAVQSLGQAAQRGGLQDAIKQQGLELADRLRGFKSATQQMEQGVRVMEQVGKVAVETLQNPKLILPQRAAGRAPKEIYARVGCIVIKDLRVFTKDSWIKTDQVETSSKGSSKNGTKPPSVPAVTHSGWNKPIYIDHMNVRASELCPPLSMKDKDGLPAVYQTMDKIVDFVFKRLLAEMAKTNSGRLFQTAVGEIISFMKSNKNAVANTGGAVAANSSNPAVATATTPITNNSIGHVNTDAGMTLQGIPSVKLNTSTVPYNVKRQNSPFDRRLAAQEQQQRQQQQERRRLQHVSVDSLMKAQSTSTSQLPPVKDWQEVRV